MAQKVDLSTIVSGTVRVTVEGVGTFSVCSLSQSLQSCAGNVYAFLTKKPLFDNGDFFEFLSFAIIKGKSELVVKVK